MIQEPGFFAVRDELVVDPWPDVAAELGRILEPVAAQLGATDTVLVPAADRIASNNGAGLDAAFTTTIGHAEATLDQHLNDGNDATVFVLDDRGELTIGLRNEVAPYLPPVNTPIPGDFSNPPGPPQPTQPPQDEPPDAGNI